MPEQLQWQIQPLLEPPTWFVEAVQSYAGEASGVWAAQLLWQRGIHDLNQLAGFLEPNCFQPTDPFAFGQEMQWAIDRLQQARQNAEKIAIWGDFDADGITATAVLWEGLKQFFSQEQLTYFIPNRLTDSHGLSTQGLEQLAAWGCQLVVTCDTGSTNLVEIEFARKLKIDVIVTDHHTLPKPSSEQPAENRPPVTAILNPRFLGADHPLAHLSGVAVAYKLVEALYKTLPDVPQQPIETLLDLVAIGLIADLVELTGDCRYLAQRGIAQLQKNRGDAAPRPGIAKLLELCRKTGDRPTDISFGLGPRINAISRIQGNAQFCVELLTSQDWQRCHQLAIETEAANGRRKLLQRDVVRQVKAKLARLDLSTTRAIVLADPQWSIGILGLVAGQIAQEYGRPTFLLTFSESEAAIEDNCKPLAKGSARSAQQIDLYPLLNEQSHLLHSFGGHPFAAGLSLPVDNIALFAEVINQRLRQQTAEAPAAAVIRADLTVTVAVLQQENGKMLFDALKLLEPCGMGNPAPQLLIRNCWFTNPWHRKFKGSRQDEDGFIKADFLLCDETAQRGFPGVWWGHYKDEIPVGQRCDAIVQLDFNSYQDTKRDMRYEVRLIALRAAASAVATDVPPPIKPIDWILDWRNGNRLQENQTDAEAVLQITTCPKNWTELQSELQTAARTKQKLALAYPQPISLPPSEVWQQLVGIAKYLSRTQMTATPRLLCEKLDIGEQALQVGLQSLQLVGFSLTQADELRFSWSAEELQTSEAAEAQAIALFSAAVQEEQFYRRYFYEVPLTMLQTVAQQLIQQTY
ncbi:single-stranded-DNA-specific exonuclease RecJ [Phormidium tenue FACHB-886]|nr:single-stranded-DNA-specific exonuclease RecJ [Phormidium tenue FACHB-886]